ncbi:MAG TPA: DUF1501 domain-containing protein, partial [Roseimicrobium sp.]|nr:DUF1501 domain-containing protein [Roseimicrobium sp.]
MNPDFLQRLNRRQFFAGAGLSAGSIALAMMGGLPGMLGAASKKGERVHPSQPGLPHFAPKAKRLIYLHMNGGPSQIDTFDYKPKLAEYFDKELPDSIRKGQRI